MRWRSYALLQVEKKAARTCGIIAYPDSEASSQFDSFGSLGMLFYSSFKPPVGKDKDATRKEAAQNKA